MKSKILIIAPTPFFSHRGCHIRIYEMVKRLEKKYQPIILTYPVGENIKGINITRADFPKTDNDIKIGPSFIRIIYDFLMLIKGIKILQNSEAPYIFSFLHEGIIIGKVLSILFQKRLISDIQGSLPGEISEHTGIKKSSFLFQVIQFIERCILSLPDTLLVNTNYLASRIKRRKGIYVVPDFLPSERDITHKREKAIVYVGVLTEYQGIEYLLKIMRYFKKNKKGFTLYIIGYPNIEKYKEKCITMGIEENVKFLGKISYFKIGNYLKNGMVSVSPKFSQYEGNGKLLLYLAYNLPIVVFDSPINREILKDAGIYILPGNVEMMAEKIALLLENKDLYEKYQALSQKRYMELVKETEGLITKIPEKD